MNKIAVIGRGGVGKTSFVALLTKYLRSKNNSSLLLIDADPDQNLAQLLGLDLEQLKINTISDVLYDVRYGNISEKLKSFGLAQKIEYLVNQKALYEGEDFDLLSIGTKWTEGCYCQPNNILKGLIAGLEKNYDYILIDSPAGIEHLNRRITSSVDNIFAILDPTKKALEHVERAYKIMSEVKIKFNNFYVLGNYRFKEELLGPIEKNDKFRYIGKLQYDANVEQLNFEGKSLLDISQDSVILNSVRKILKNTQIE